VNLAAKLGRDSPPFRLGCDLPELKVARQRLAGVSSDHPPGGGACRREAHRACQPNPHSPWSAHRLTFRYVGVNVSNPEAVRYRYRLDGVDSAWSEPTALREIDYTNVPPGRFRFQVAARNNSGVWNEAGTFLDFSIDPACYQTNWFRALCAAAFLALLCVLYQVRIQQVRRQERKLRDVIETIPTFAWTALPDGSVDFVNRHWQEYAGLSTDWRTRRGKNRRLVRFVPHSTPDTATSSRIEFLQSGRSWTGDRSELGSRTSMAACDSDISFRASSLPTLGMRTPVYSARPQHSLVRPGNQRVHLGWYLGFGCGTDQRVLRRRLLSFAVQS